MKPSNLTIEFALSFQYSKMEILPATTQIFTEVFVNLNVTTATGNILLVIKTWVIWSEDKFYLFKKDKLNTNYI